MECKSKDKLLKKLEARQEYLDREIANDQKDKMEEQVLQEMNRSVPDAYQDG